MVTNTVISVMCKLEDSIRNAKRGEQRKEIYAQRNNKNIPSDNAVAGNLFAVHIFKSINGKCKTLTFRDFLKVSSLPQSAAH